MRERALGCNGSLGVGLVCEFPCGFPCGLTCEFSQGSAAVVGFGFGVEFSCGLDNELEFGSEVTWRRTKNGKISVKSAYSLLLEIEARGVALSSTTSPTSVANPGRLRSCLWSLPVPPRVKVLGRKICSEAIPALVKLARRHRDVDTRCAVCGAESKTENTSSLSANLLGWPRKFQTSHGASWRIGGTVLRDGY
ncbi:hypothetical protein Salat_0663900 [Sesamum alatum]|uniref:Uncharacterized protein n=1 Tax=Sesamum alatum TaxID=300844 RepID=A0AAE1YRP1_9LAMI|nr:hypothetical protein Salat_0663900 [Sesamum alatum]